MKRTDIISRINEIKNSYNLGGLANDIEDLQTHYENVLANLNKLIEKLDELPDRKK